MKTTDIYTTKDLETFKKLIAKEIPKIFSKGEKIAIKLHMGELGNKNHIKPEFVKLIVDVLKNVGANPFLFDSPIAYNSPRRFCKGYLLVAKKKGFTEKKVGCKVVISDEFITEKTKSMKYEVCKELVEADGVLTLSHVKGHMCSGFGGAIKNLGMGALTKKTKREVHNNSKPEYVGGCTLCGLCAKVCPTKHIKYQDEKPLFKRTWCCGCSTCIHVCPNNAIKPKVAIFDFLLSEGAWCAYKNFKKSFFINSITNVSKFCDCSPIGGKIIAKDAGFVLGKTAVAVDKASFDIILEQEGKDVFKETHHKSPLVHIREAAKLGLGSLKYNKKTF